MDPIAAIGFAANILQFINFGCKLVSESQQIYNSVEGASVETLELEAISKHLHDLIEQVDVLGIPTSLQGHVRTCKETSTEISDAVSLLRINANEKHRR